MLAALYPEVLQGFQIFGIVKETGVDDSGLWEFHETYFPYPIYCDKSWAFYNALGNRKVGINSLIWNPFTLFSILCETLQRLKDKKIEGNMTGEGLVQGGIVFFGKDGRPKYAYQEQTGVDLPVKDIVATIKAMKQQMS